MNETNTDQNQMQKGFRAFILTLSISLIVFSVIYYFISGTDSTKNASIQSVQLTNADTGSVAGVSDTNTTEAVLATTVAENQPTLLNEQSIVVPEEPSVFAKISATPVDVASRAVLAGSTSITKASTSPVVVKTTTTAAVPSGGVTQLTWGFFISLVSFVLGFVVISRDPRRLALEDFEKKMVD